MSEPLSFTTRFFESPEVIHLEYGAKLQGARVAYRTWGTPRPEAVLVCHALTGNADADDWWEGLFGQGKTLDPDKDYIISSNVLGSCYGTTGPTSYPGGSVDWYGSRFPTVTIRDMVQVQAALLDHLGVKRLKLVIGGSLGAMQALEWAAMFPDRVDAVAAIAAGATQSAWAVGFSEAQKAAIEADARFRDGFYLPGDGPDDGLAAARMIAMVSYRGPDSFETRFGRRQTEEGFEVQSYLRYQGRKLVERFDANTYLGLVEAMDSHDLGRGRGPLEKALAAIDVPTLAVGITSDVLYPIAEVRALAGALPNCRYETLVASHGHDSFLIETDDLNRIVMKFARDVGEGRPAVQARYLTTGEGAARE